MKRDTRADALKRFRRDTEQHRLTVEINNGLHRSLLFRRAGDSSYWFRLVTWPGALAIDGDMGAHVFRRLPDMFEFFRGNGDFNERSINPSYWAEKLQSSRATDAPCVVEFDRDAFVEVIVSCVRDRFRDGCKSEQLAVWNAVREEVLERVDDSTPTDEAIRLAVEFVHHLPPQMNGRKRRFEFEDFWEHRCTRHTFHFLWNLYAIVWGIAQYDAHRAASEAPAEPAEVPA